MASITGRAALAFGWLMIVPVVMFDAMTKLARLIPPVLTAIPEYPVLSESCPKYQLEVPALMRRMELAMVPTVTVDPSSEICEAVIVLAVDVNFGMTPLDPVPWVGV